MNEIVPVSGLFQGPASKFTSAGFLHIEKIWYEQKAK